MADLAQLTFEVIKDRLPKGYTLTDWKEGTKSFEFIPVQVGDETVGAIMARGPELHVSILPAYRCKWMNKKVMRFIKDRAHQFGFVQTLVSNEHQAGHKFAERLGFKRADQNEAVTLYRMEYAK